MCTHIDPDYYIIYKIDRGRNISNYRASPVAHANVALDIQRRRTREPEGLHVSEDLGLEQAALRPGAPKPADQFVVDRTSVLIDQLNPLVPAVMRVAVVHDDIETVCVEEEIDVIQSRHGFVASSAKRGNFCYYLQKIYKKMYTYVYIWYSGIIFE